MADDERALDWLFQFTDWERGIGWGRGTDADASWNLRRTRWLLDAVGRPDRDVPVILIAGTKGKGSTAAMIESIARSAGLSTALYTQPHLQEYRERVRLDGEPIDAGDFARLVDRFRQPVARMRLEQPEAGEPTTYEITTALAMLAAQEHRADLAVIEVGLGGRLDATNCLDPAVSVLTRVSYDHTQILGSTLAAITLEKAAIARAGRPLVSALQRPASRREVIRSARQLGARYRFVPPLASAAVVAVPSPRGQGVAGAFCGRRFEGELRLLGEHQRENAAVAVAVSEELVQQGVVRLAVEHVQQGLEAVRWPGRLEIVRESPKIVLDGAHNGESAERLVNALVESFKFRRLILVLGILRDKDARAMLRWLAPAADAIVATRSASPRALQPTDLERLARNHGSEVETSVDIADALRRACDLAGRDDLICVTGSLTVVGEARALLMASSEPSA